MKLYFSHSWTVEYCVCFLSVSNISYRNVTSTDCKSYRDGKALCMLLKVEVILKVIELTMYKRITIIVRYR